MNTHSYGGYFMWPPGAYKAAGRELLPRVDFGTENYFWDASGHILSAVQSYRGTAIWPGRTGPVPDVLYSAAGNSADEHWFNRGIIGWDFEVGADLYNPATKQFEAVGFQPPFAEGHEEAMEFANGQIAHPRGRPGLRRGQVRPDVEAGRDRTRAPAPTDVHLRDQRAGERLLHAGRQPADADLAEARRRRACVRARSRSRSTEDHGALVRRRHRRQRWRRCGRRSSTYPRS